MDENGEILLLHASNNNARPLVLPWFDDFEIKLYSLFTVYVGLYFVANLKGYNPKGYLETKLQ